VNIHRDIKIYRDRRDWWIGYYQGDTHHYICPIPTIVIRWPRHHPEDGTDG
jgi:hypothetical protein